MYLGNKTLHVQAFQTELYSAFSLPASDVLHVHTHTHTLSLINVFQTSARTVVFFVCFLIRK